MDETQARSRFVDCLNETDPEVRAELLVRHCSPAVTYTGPSGPVVGYDAVARAIAAAQTSSPGRMMAPSDVVVLATDADGRISAVAARAAEDRVAGSQADGGAEGQVAAARISAAVAASAG